MADGLKGTARPTLHQSLHGYADGHRQLALSTTLKPRDQKILLTLSDVSGAGARLSAQGYLTGYPLTDSGYYALAQTWPAPEMPRPGCVWTHTLLIDFTDLATVDALEGLAKLFKRPERSTGFSEYGVAKHLPKARHYTSHIAADPWIRSILSALYETPHKQIVAIRSRDDSDEIVLSIWSQQWPRLRRNFRFCTYSASDRSFDNFTFDLQLVSPLDHSTQTRFSKAISAERSSSTGGPWLESALYDLGNPDSDGLRAFFRRVGSDIAAGREAFRPLCRLHGLISESGANPRAIPASIRLLRRERELSQANSARAIISNAALSNLEVLDEPSFEFLWDNLGLLDPKILNSASARLGQLAWRRDPRRLAELLKTNNEHAELVRNTLSTLDLATLAAGLRQAPSLVGLAFTLRPELASLAEFWSNPTADEHTVQMAADAGLERSAVVAMLHSGRDDLAFAAVRLFGAIVALRALGQVQDPVDDRAFANWVRIAAGERETVAQFLVSERGIHRRLLSDLARTIPPDAISNQNGTDPWMAAWRNSVGETDERDSVYLAAYFFRRALGVWWNEADRLAQVGFERFYAAAARSTLSDEAWNLVESRLPWSPFWFEWDRCRRIRAGVVELFLLRDLPPDTFGHLVQNDELFGVLVGVAAQSRRGRRYLKRVRRAMTEDNDFSLGIRPRIIDEFLGSASY